jgi:hypothetical protein
VGNDVERAVAEDCIAQREEPPVRVRVARRLEERVILAELRRDARDVECAAGCREDEVDSRAGLLWCFGTRMCVFGKAVEDHTQRCEGSVLSPTLCLGSSGGRRAGLGA